MHIDDQKKDYKDNFYEEHCFKTHFLMLILSLYYNNLGQKENFLYGKIKKLIQNG